MTPLLNPQIDHLRTGQVAIVACDELVDLLLDLRNELEGSWRDLSASSEPIRIIDRHLRTIRRFKRVSGPEASTIVDDVVLAMLEAAWLTDPTQLPIPTTGDANPTADSDDEADEPEPLPAARRHSLFARRRSARSSVITTSR